MSPDASREEAVLGGGCFWCLEAIYLRMPGVLDVGSGYAGGHVESPSYEQVCGKQTGHAEVVKVGFDPGKTSYPEILKMFWQAHDPTTPDRQGHDVGPQYRSIILYENEGQEKQARESAKEAQGLFKDPIVTEIVPLDKFWPAEPGHQDYYNRNQMAPYCLFNITPKLKKLGL